MHHSISRPHWFALPEALWSRLFVFHPAASCLPADLHDPSSSPPSVHQPYKICISAQFIIHGFTTAQFIIHGYAPARFIIHGFATTPDGGPSVGPSSSSHWFGSIAPTS
ncbi:hypothetical protein Salat_0843700 [Sesamum alatum]|uniref:Uncharacterized protein n=1 Tax=Sesamum alatum TaxID=300844 RepID=A0AAE2CQI2_9LAMI|nr:hypothetical protein Salat_0843700 [Sesamum alatum]